MEIVFGWLVFAGLVAWLANSRGRSGVGYFLLSFLLSPLVGLIVVLVSKDLVREAEKEAKEEARRKQDHEAHLESLRALTSSQRTVETPAPSPAQSAAPRMRACPFCAEEIRAEAIKCKHCGSEVAALAVAQAQPDSTEPSQALGSLDPTAPPLAGQWSNQVVRAPRVD